MRETGRGRVFPYIRRRSDTIASEVDEELNAHLEMRTDGLVAQGMSRQDARREALRQFGDLDGTRRYCRRQDEGRESRMQGQLLLADLLEDLRVGARGLLRAPVLALAIVTTVGLGTGGTAAIFAAVDAALLRPLPYPQPERLVRIYTDSPPFWFRFSAVDYLALESQQTSFDGLATYTGRVMTFTAITRAPPVPLAPRRSIRADRARPLRNRRLRRHDLLRAATREGDEHSDGSRR